MSSSTDSTNSPAESRPPERDATGGRDISLDDLIDDKDRLLTSGQVAELLNVNVNTLYLWRTTPGEINLPYLRFVAPGQTRGMIRYLHSEVLKFLQDARAKANEEMAAAQAAASAESSRPTSPRAPRVGAAAGSDSSERAERRRQRSSKAKRDALLEKPLVTLLQDQEAARRSELQAVEKSVPATNVASDDSAAQARDRILAALKNMGIDPNNPVPPSTINKETS